MLNFINRGLDLSYVPRWICVKLASLLIFSASTAFGLNLYVVSVDRTFVVHSHYGRPKSGQN